jgi:uncharacterized protein (TIGR02996 family)
VARKRAPAAESGFLHDICAHPEDDAPRLVFADWLDDHGDPERAEFIRVQCRLAGLAEEPARDDLADRAWELLLRHGDSWRQALPAWVRKQYHEFRRGFVGSLTLTANQFLRQGTKLLQAVPLECVGLRAIRHTLPDVAACPHLGQMKTLDLAWNNRIADELAVLFASPHLGGLTGLILRQTGLDDDDLEVLTRWRGLKRIAHLDVGNCPYTLAGLRRLLASRHLAGLRSLDLTGKTFGDDLALLLAESAALAGVVRLSLHGCHAGARGIRALARSPHTRRLTDLKLSASAGGTEGAQALATSPLLGQLTNLDLSNNRLDSEALAALADSPHLGRLRSLGLRAVALGTAGAVALATSPQLANLRELDLTANGIGDEGARALAASPHLANLRRLKLHSNGLTPSVIEHLAASPHLSQLRHLDLGGNRALHQGRDGDAVKALLRNCFRLPRLLVVEGGDLLLLPVTLLRPAEA